MAASVLPNRRGRQIYKDPVGKHNGKDVATCAHLAVARRIGKERPRRANHAAFIVDKRMQGFLRCVVSHKASLRRDGLGTDCTLWSPASGPLLLQLVHANLGYAVVDSYGRRRGEGTYALKPRHRTAVAVWGRGDWF